MSGGDLAEGQFESIARDRSLREPAQQRTILLGDIGATLLELGLGEAKLRGRQRQIEVIFIALGQRVDHLDAIELECGIETCTLHGICEALAVALNKGIHLVVRRIKPLDLLPNIPGKVRPFRTSSRTSSLALRMP